MSLDELAVVEGQLDEKFRSLQIWRAPIRPILASLHTVCDSLFHGSRSGPAPVARPAAGAAFGSRLSYLVPQVLMSAPGLIGTGASESIAAVHEIDPDLSDRQFLVGYAHFCELMPEVHRGYYAVERRAGGFKLVHISQAFAEHEVADLIYNEMALAFSDAPPPNFNVEFDRQAAAWPHYDCNLHLQTLGALHEHYRASIREEALLSDEGFAAAIGQTYSEYQSFRAALFAHADYCRGMASAHERLLRGAGFPQAIYDEMLEWISVNFNERFLLGTVEGLTGISAASIDRAIALFSIDCRPGRVAAPNAADGFFPPLARFEESFLFNPDLLMTFLPSRNVLYALNRTDRGLFENLISQDLEPVLIDEVVAILRRFSGLTIVKGHRWDDGELDLLVYSARHECVLHIQAKAAIAPQGARTVRAVEGRMLEGLRQLERLRDLPQAQRDEVIGRALRSDVHGVIVHDVLLSRSSIGTDAVWSHLDNVIPVNPSILRLALSQTGNDDFDPRRLGELIQTTVARLAADAETQWTSDELVIGDIVLEIPLLSLRAEEMDQARARAAAVPVR